MVGVGGSPALGAANTSRPLLNTQTGTSCATLWSLPSSADAERGMTKAGWIGVSCAVSVACGSGGNPTASESTSPPPAQPFSITAAVQGPGRVTSTPAGIDCGNACTARFFPPTQVELDGVACAGVRRDLERRMLRVWRVRRRDRRASDRSIRHHDASGAGKRQSRRIGQGRLRSPGHRLPVDVQRGVHRRNVSRADRNAGRRLVICRLQRRLHGTAMLRLNQRGE